MSQGYAPFGGRAGSEQLLGNPVVCKIAAQHNIHPARIILQWSLQHGVCIIPKSTQEGHIAQNSPQCLLCDSTGNSETPLQLSDDEMIALDNLGEQSYTDNVHDSTSNPADGNQQVGKRFCWDPSTIH